MKDKINVTDINDQSFCTTQLKLNTFRISHTTKSPTLSFKHKANIHVKLQAAPNYCKAVTIAFELSATSAQWCYPSGGGMRTSTALVGRIKKSFRKRRRRTNCPSLAHGSGHPYSSPYPLLMSSLHFLPEGIKTILELQYNKQDREYWNV